MGTGRTFNKAPVSRPKKKLRERIRRVNTQKKRLVALGMDETLVAKMDPPVVREFLRCPDKISAS